MIYSLNRCLILSHNIMLIYFIQSCLHFKQMIIDIMKPRVKALPINIKEMNLYTSVYKLTEQFMMENSILIKADLSWN
jgi:hypothetical protein